MEPLTLHAFPRAIVHIDGDAFFASCEQSRRPKLQGRPVVTGKERGIAASMSYEAKARGVTRGMRLAEVRQRCPEAVILPSDYETYSLLSTRFFAIVRRYTPDVEEYSVDECFADLTGLRRPLRMSYLQIAEQIKKDLDTELGFTFSVGPAPNKVVAKIASKWQKPSGLTAIPGRELHHYLIQLPVEQVWGIGPQTTAFLHKHGMQTALALARRQEEWVKKYLSKPFYQIWQELNGAYIFELVTGEHETYHTLQKVKTFTPASSDHDFVFAQLAINIENACIKLRKHVFQGMLRLYELTLAWVLRHQFLILLVTLTTIVVTVRLYISIPKGFFPQQDTGGLFGQIQADQSSSFQAVRHLLQQFVTLVGEAPAVEHVLGFTGGSYGGSVNTARMFIQLKPLEARQISADQVLARLRGTLARVPGAVSFQ